jgi:hypothetical protein
MHGDSHVNGSESKRLTPALSRSVAVRVCTQTMCPCLEVSAVHRKELNQAIAWDRTKRSDLRHLKSGAHVWQRTASRLIDAASSGLTHQIKGLDQVLKF